MGGFYLYGGKTVTEGSELKTGKNKGVEESSAPFIGYGRENNGYCFCAAEVRRAAGVASPRRINSEVTVSFCRAR